MDKKNIEPITKNTSGQKSLLLDNWYEICLPMMLLGHCMTLDIPMLLAPPFTRDGIATDNQIMQLYAQYCMPAQFTGICIGMYLTKIGPNLIYVFLACTQFGQMLFNYGIWWANFNMMAIGRVILGFGNMSLFSALNYLVKLYIKEETVFKVNAYNQAASRLFMTLSFFINPWLYINTGNYDAVNYLSIFTILFMIGCFVVLNVMTSRKRQGGNKPKKEDKFKISDLKGYSFKFYLLQGCNVFTNAIFCSFSSMAERYQEVGCKISYSDTKDIQALGSFFSILAVFLSAWLIRYYTTEIELLFYSTVMLFVLNLSVPFIQGEGYLYASIMNAAFWIFDGQFIATFYSQLIKSLTVKQVSIGVFVSTFIMNVGWVLYPIVNGALMGELATKATIIHVLIFMTVIALCGMVCAFCLVFLERKETKNEISFNSENIEMGSLTN